MARIGSNIYKRKDGRFEGRYEKGRMENGRIHYGYIYGHSRNEVKERIASLKGKPGGLKVNRNNKYYIVSQWLEYWLKHIIKPNVKESTYQNYLWLIKQRICPLLGEEYMDRLNSRDIQNFVNTLKGENLSPTYICGIFRLLKSSLERAADRGIIFVNPCRNISLPKKVKPKINPLTLDEQKALEETALNDKHGAAVMLSLYAGIRIGEACALTWEDIDFKENTINIRGTMQRIPDRSGTNNKKTKIFFGKPKSEESERIIPMAPCLREYLISLKKHSIGRYVVANKNRYTEPRSLLNIFHRLLNESNIDSRSFHTLRHTFATRCMEAGVNITAISKLLGHSSVKMTLDIYTDAVMTSKIAAVNMVEQYLFNNFSSIKSHTQENT